MTTNRITPYLESVDPDAPIPFELAPLAVTGHQALCHSIAPHLRDVHADRKIGIKRSDLILLRSDLAATKAAAEAWQARAEAASDDADKLRSELGRMKRRAVAAEEQAASLMQRRIRSKAGSVAESKLLLREIRLDPVTGITTVTRHDVASTVHTKGWQPVALTWSPRRWLETLILRICGIA